MNNIDENIFNINKSTKNIILNNILKKYNHNDKIIISNDVYNDTQIDKWAIKLPLLEGSKILINNIIKNPTNNIKLLKDRQESYIENIDLSKIILDQKDLNTLHNIIFSALDIKDLTTEQLFDYWKMLPDDLKFDCLKWGINDTVVRENIYEWFKNKK